MISRRNGQITLTGDKKDKDGKPKKLGGPYQDTPQGRIRAAKRLVQVSAEEKRKGNK